MMTALFADRLADFGINVYEVRPGIIATDMTSGVQEQYDRLIGEGLTPIRRWGQPEDVARGRGGDCRGALCLFPPAKSSTWTAASTCRRL